MRGYYRGQTNRHYELRNVQGHTLQVRGKYSGEWTDITCERNIQKMDVTSKRKLQGTDARWRSH